MVRAQRLLVDRLGIPRLFAVVGGSMGGMQALEWAATYPDQVFACVPIATAPFHSAQNIAFHEVGRQAIFADPDWDGGDYWRAGKIPARGLAVARMAAHITYLSEQALTRKFGRRPARPRRAASGRRHPVRRHVRGGELPAPPGQHLRPPLRRQLVPDHHPGDGPASTSPPSMTATWPRPSAARAPGSASCPSQRLAVPHRPVPRHRPRAQPRRRQRQLRRDQHRQGA